MRAELRYTRNEKETATFTTCLIKTCLHQPKATVNTNSHKLNNSNNNNNNAPWLRKDQRA